MKINENTISVFLLGILIGIVFVRYVNYFKKPIQDIDIDNFEYEKESLYTIKREELKNNYYQCLDQKVYWGTDSLQTSTLRELCSDEKLFFCFSETTCPPCIETVIDMLNGAFSKEEIDKRVIFVSPDYPIRLRNDCYGRKLLNLQNKIFGLPLERQESFPPFLFVLDNKLRVKYLHIYNKVFPQLTSIYLEEIKFSD
ncbi:hypothetical protein [Parabacteroides sp.]|uniref:hypothetical protein n=1 Tax=Parabacteroides sp. TaxID=1869337 RepID=UPI002580E37F|nr:hypothetical protein [Parabacteroides sp.]